jgi:nucleoside-diphosphate-sugar epimerase
VKALVTGDRGFIGRHFVDFLKAQGWEVYGLDIRNGLDEDVIPYFLENDSESFDLLVHCAYEVGGRGHIDGANLALANNLTLDATMFQWALNGGADAVIYFSSSAAYPTRWQAEGSALRLYEGLISSDSLEVPDADYGWAKLTGERVARKAQALGLRVHILRPFSGYGPDQDLTYPFPSIVKRAMKGELDVWGPPGQTRDWIHVSDVVNGAWAVYEADERDPVNLCTGVGTEMGDLMALARTHYLSIVGEPVNDLTVNYDENKPTGVFYRVGDPGKFHRYYRPKVALADGIREAILYFLDRG